MASIACPKCSAPWPVDAAQLGAMNSCPICGANVSVMPFPALLREPAIKVQQPDSILSEGEASCFYHPKKRATVPCGSCGRFLCALCDVQLGGRTLCPSCLEAGRTKGKLSELESNRFLWDTTALVLATVPLLLCLYPSILGAPAALVVAIMGWNKPTSVVPRGRWRLWLAILLSTLQIAGWIVFFIMIVTGGFAAMGG